MTRDGKWAKAHDCCVTCGTTERPHQARGLCRRCYAARLKELNPNHRAEQYARVKELHPYHIAEQYARQLELHPDFSASSTASARKRRAGDIAAQTFFSLNELKKLKNNPEEGQEES